MGERMADRITKLLHERNMTQKELALSANITESTVSHYRRPCSKRGKFG